MPASSPFPTYGMMSGGWGTMAPKMIDMEYTFFLIYIVP